MTPPTAIQLDRYERALRLIANMDYRCSQDMATLYVSCDVSIPERMQEIAEDALKP